MTTGRTGLPKRQKDDYGDRRRRFALIRRSAADVSASLRVRATLLHHLSHISVRIHPKCTAKRRAIKEKENYTVNHVSDRR